MLEELQQEFPGYGRTQLLFEINKAMRRFAQRTKIYHGVAIRNRADHLTSEDEAEETTIYTLPNNVYEVISVDELLRDQYEVRDTDLYIWFTDNEMDELTVRYFALPVPLVNDSDSPPFEEQFHDVIPCMVRRKLYQKAGKLQLMQVEDAYIREAEADAKRYVNTSYYRNTGAFSGDEMQYIIVHGSQDLVAGENTISFSPREYTNVNSFTVILNGNGVAVEEYDPNNNHDQRTVSSFKVMSADTNTNFEYFVIGT